MQCSMHLETAYSFYMTCLETEQMLRRHNTRSVFAKKYAEEEYKNEEKKYQMICQTCNVQFSSKNMLDLHINVMHTKEDKPDGNIEGSDIQAEDDDMPELEMVYATKNYLDESSNSEQIRITRKRKGGKPPVLENQKHYLPNYKQAHVENETGINLSNIETEDEAIDDKIKLTENKIGNLKSNQNCSLADRSNSDIKMHRCRFCTKKFLRIGGLTRHVSLAHPERAKTCLVCKRMYTNKKSHKQQYGCQVQNVEEQNVGPWSVAWKMSLDKVRIYYRPIVGKSTHMCLICNRKCHSFIELEKHLNLKHPNAKCGLCSKSFPPIEYCTHVALGCSELVARQCFNYTSDGNCICPMCNAVLSNRKTLRAHMVQHLYDPLQCKTCGFKYTRITSYCQHIVKGCTRKSISTVTKSDLDTSMETNPETVTSTQEDPIDDESPESPTLNLISNNKSVKIEPTELLDQNGYLSSAELDCENENQEDNLEFIDVGSVTNEIQEDTPDLVYIVSNGDKTNEQHMH
ncbi:hypothetical protein AMK59_2893 [Oryctes borbonicus]|uniref:C2H2-type domain-containing protein n=1 Tax=Oryctes borbonicus TaxID=1629725 RepID=A0A0T6BD54_9SCAR|nr:hypothetical protein AMK59_2893 [Oryctes borbonicus]